MPPDTRVSTPPPRAQRRSGLVRLVPLIPAAALLLGIVLPFVNGPHLWLGVPSLFVWTSVWVLLVCPALLLVERAGYGPDGGSDER